MIKIIKKITLILIATPFVLLFICAIFFFTYALLAIGGESTEHQLYLKRNMQEVIIGKNDFHLFDEGFYDSKVIMLGEVHGFAMPQELDYELLMHLNQKIGLTQYLAEVDFSQAYFLNQYLETGDEHLLDKVFQTWVNYNAQWANKEFYYKLQKIHAYNQTITADSKISIVGVDKIQDIDVTKRHLLELLKTAKQDFKFNHSLDSLSMLLLDSSNNLKDLQLFASNYLTDSSKSSSVQINQSNLEHILANLTYQYNSVKRDSVMFLNLKNLTEINQWENKQFYGMWGLMHILQEQVNENYSSFAYLLKSQESPFKNKVTTISIFSIESENMIPTGMMPASISKGQAYVTTSWVNSDGPLAFVKGIKDLRALTNENSMTIFKLDGDMSPYRASSLLATTRVLIPGQSGINLNTYKPTITQLCQYAVLIRNSKATTPIKAEK